MCGGCRYSYCLYAFVGDYSQWIYCIHTSLWKDKNENYNKKKEQKENKEKKEQLLKHCGRVQ